VSIFFQMGIRLLLSAIVLSNKLSSLQNKLNFIVLFCIIIFVIKKLKFSLRHRKLQNICLIHVIDKVPANKSFILADFHLFSLPELAQGELLGSLNVRRLSSVVRSHLFVTPLAISFLIDLIKKWCNILE
jgi:hypothetical protein